MHAEYEVSISCESEVMTSLKLTIQNGLDQEHKVIGFCVIWINFIDKICKYNMKALCKDSKVMLKFKLFFYSERLVLEQGSQSGSRGH